MDYRSGTVDGNARSEQAVDNATCALSRWQHFTE